MAKTARQPDCFRRWIGLSVAIGWLLLSATALAEPAETTQLRVERIPGPERTDVPAQAMRETIRAFLKDHPGVTVEPFTMPKIGPSAMDSGPLMAIAAGVPPHVIYVNFRQTSTYIGQGFLAPMEVLLARILSEDPNLRAHDGKRFLDEPSPAQIDAARELIRQRVPENAWPVVYRDDESGRVFDEFGNPPKHVWAVPYGPVVIAMLYRRDLFNQAGLNPDAPPETWDELLDAARRLTVPERSQYGIAVSSLLSYSTYGFLVSQGGRAVEQADDGSWRAAYDSQEAAEAYSYVWELLRGPFER
ncbi:MAG: extracellular solute-binding protein, partial [Planctomycetota bacterium]